MVIATAVASVGLATGAQAFQFETGSDWDVRWDNTLRYNAMFRLKDPDDELASAPLYDDATLSFDKGLVSNRLDLISELDVIWKGKHGFRISAAAWYDTVYNTDSDHPDTSYTWGSPSVRVGKFNDEAVDLHGRDAELLDAFIFGNFQIGEQSLGIRAGRHTLFWGQSLLTGGAVHGVAGSMAPIDAAKAFSVPGAEVQELFMPTTKLSASWQVMPNLTLEGYYSLEFREHRLPAVGSFASTAEVLTREDEFATLIPVPGLGAFGQKGVSAEDEDSGEFGLGMQFYSRAADADFGAYYLNFHDKLPHGLMTELNLLQLPAEMGGFGLIPPEQVGPVNYSVGRMKMVYKDDIDLFGLTASKELWGVSFGADLVYRQDQPVAMDLLSAFTGRLAFTPPGIATEFDSFDAGNYGGSTGDTLHLVVNAFGFMPVSKWWDGGSYIAEFNASKLNDLNDEYSEFAAVWLRNDDGKVLDSRIQTAIAVKVVPEWYQVWPSWDVKLPVSVSYGLNNNSALTLGGTQDQGNFSIGTTFLYKQDMQLDITYSQPLGSESLSKDRDWISLTAKYTF